MRKVIRLLQGEMTECAFCEKDAEYRVLKNQMACCKDHIDLGSEYDPRSETKPMSVKEESDGLCESCV